MWTDTPPKDLQQIWHDFAGLYFQNKDINSILDVGTGWGKSKERLQRITPNVKTQDINQALMEIVDYICYTEDISDKFDLVTAFDVFEHVPNLYKRSFMLDLHLISNRHIFYTAPNKLFFKESRPWRFSPLEFLEHIEKFYGFMDHGKLYDFEYFLRQKTSNSDLIEQVDRVDFIEKNSYGLGIHVRKKS